jgi:hypothetical protein
MRNAEVFFWLLCYLKFLDTFQEFRRNNTRKQVHINISSQTLTFLGTAFTFARPDSIRFLSVGTQKTLM